jgi:hypothetical protein
VSSLTASLVAGSSRDAAALGERLAADYPPPRRDGNAGEPLDTIEIQTAPTAPLELCETGCGRAAAVIVVAIADPLFACSFACDHHRADAEVHAIRRLASLLEVELAERRRDLSARTAAGRRPGV